MAHDPSSRRSPSDVRGVRICRLRSVLHRDKWSSSPLTSGGDTLDCCAKSWAIVPRCYPSWYGVASWCATCTLVFAITRRSSVIVFPHQMLGQSFKTKLVLCLVHGRLLALGGFTSTHLSGSAVNRKTSFVLLIFLSLQEGCRGVWNAEFRLDGCDTPLRSLSFPSQRLFVFRSGRVAKRGRVIRKGAEMPRDPHSVQKEKHQRVDHVLLAEKGTSTHEQQKRQCIRASEDRPRKRGHQSNKASPRHPLSLLSLSPTTLTQRRGQTKQHSIDAPTYQKKGDCSHTFFNSHQHDQFVKNMNSFDKSTVSGDKSHFL